MWQADGNFFRTSITHSLTAGNLYTEQSKDNPGGTNGEGSRVQAGNNITIMPNSSQPVTIRMRMARVNAANTVTAQYRIVAPASAASPDWVNFGANAAWTSGGGLALNTTPTRRDAAGSRIGIIAQSNFPGTTGTYAVPGHPGHGRRRLLPGHPGSADLRDRRPDHHGDARPGRSGDRRHVQPLGQGQPVGD